MAITKVEKQSVALFLSKKTVPQIIADANSYVTKMTGNAYFPAPSPPLATITAQTNTLIASQIVASTRAKGASAQMHTDLKVLEVSLKSLGSYVATIANQTPSNAVAIINSAGMQARKHTARTPKVFTIKQGPTPGVVEVNSKAVKRGSYIYQYTTDQTMANSWVDGYKNMKVKGTITGLTPGTRYYFRVAAVTPSGESAWSPIISFVVN
jgi:hypothetical protein